MRGHSTRASKTLLPFEGKTVSQASSAISGVDIASVLAVLIVFGSCVDIRVSSNVKIVYLLVPFVAIVLFIKLSNGKIIERKADWLLLSWYLSYFLAIGHIVSAGDFIVVLVGQLALFVIYGLFQRIRTESSLRRIERWFKVALQLSVLIGAWQLLAFYLIGSTWGISHLEHGAMLPRMRGLLLEPDWYAVICMIAALMTMIDVLDCAYLLGRSADVALLSMDLLMLALSLTRASWVGFAAALLVLLFFNRHGSIVRGKWHLVLAICAIAPCALILYAVIDSVGAAKLLSRFDVTRWSSDGGAFTSRQSSIDVMMHYIALHPMTGNGAGSMGWISTNGSLLASLGYPYEINVGRGNANVFVTNLFDVGIAGTSLLVLFFVTHIAMLIRAYRETGQLVHLKYVLLLIALLVDFQFNNGLRQAYVWIILGLSASWLLIADARTKKRRAIVPAAVEYAGFRIRPLHSRC